MTVTIENLAHADELGVPGAEAVHPILQIMAPGLLFIVPVAESDGFRDEEGEVISEAGLYLTGGPHLGERWGLSSDSAAGADTVALWRTEGSALAGLVIASVLTDEPGLSQTFMWEPADEPRPIEEVIAGFVSTAPEGVTVTQVTVYFPNGDVQDVPVA